MRCVTSSLFFSVSARSNWSVWWTTSRKLSTVCSRNRGTLLKKRKSVCRKCERNPTKTRSLSTRHLPQLTTTPSQGQKPSILCSKQIFCSLTWLQRDRFNFNLVSGLDLWPNSDWFEPWFLRIKQEMRKSNYFFEEKKSYYTSHKLI